MLCDVVRGALSDLEVCEDTSEGAARVLTHCLYPSFENVYVYVVKFGDNFRVHDGAGAYRNAWAHGRDRRAILRAISSEAERSKLMRIGESIVASDVGLDWLQSAILTVANVSSTAANRVAAANAASHQRDYVIEAMKKRRDDAGGGCSEEIITPWACDPLDKQRKHSLTAEQRRKARLGAMAIRNDKMKGKVTLASVGVVIAPSKTCEAER